MDVYVSNFISAKLILNLYLLKDYFDASIHVSFRIMP